MPCFYIFAHSNHWRSIVRYYRINFCVIISFARTMAPSKILVKFSAFSLGPVKSQDSRKYVWFGALCNMQTTFLVLEEEFFQPSMSKADSLSIAFPHAECFSWNLSSKVVESVLLVGGLYPGLSFFRKLLKVTDSIELWAILQPAKNSVRAMFISSFSFVETE